MAKKKIQEIEDTTKTTVEEVLVVQNERVAALDLDFGRTDLNMLVGKVNEIIEVINNG